ncbi:hypothetical protein LEP1GSC047_0157 [Leptospira inadai serovar Lyme str. 10]|uniref:Uncharacterized protein n=1 Tax=Leptospira inadai serovar Lyme str. 10 TaxID=1049790 RepID=V6HAK1_9LEPT|nr:hypothetical protein [Leptospira inadai]EQA36242.1 hypothetical protein LEP1GSC047_0157 [Leptospira inadai serovar Lyme str. 10]
MKSRLRGAAKNRNSALQSVSTSLTQGITAAENVSLLSVTA